MDRSLLKSELTRLPALLAGRRRRHLGELIGIGFGQALVGIALVLLVRHVFDLFLSQSGHPAPESDLVPLSATMAALVLADGGLRLLERVRAEVLGQDYVLEVRGRLYEHLLGVSPRALRSQNRGGMLLRFVGDQTPLRQWVSLGVARIAVASVVIPATLVVLLVLSWKFGLLVLCAYVAGGLMTFTQRSKLGLRTRDVRRLRSHLATNISEKLGALAVVQLHDQARRERKRLSQQGHRLAVASILRASVLGRVRAYLYSTTGLAKVGVLTLGVHEVAAGRATSGLVVAALTMESFLAAPMHELSRVFEYWQAACISKEKLESFLALPAAKSAEASLRRRRRGRGRLRFRRVSVRDSLHEIDADARPGQRIAIVGADGSGKSSLLSLAAGLVAPDKGRVLLDRVDLARLRPRDLSRAVSLASPDLPLLRGTLRANLCYRPVVVQEEELLRVCALCGVDEILAGLPLGLDTPMREGGLEFSLGQRRRIALARALVGTPDVLLLDEIDSNLDQPGRAALDRVLAVYPGTLLITTHDEELASRLDAIWHLEAGRLARVTTPGLGVP